MTISDPNHPLWPLARVVVVCLTLLCLQLMTASSWDLAVDGEAGTLVGTTAIVGLLEILRKSSPR